MSRTKIALILGCLGAAWLGWRLFVAPLSPDSGPVRIEAPESSGPSVVAAAPDSAPLEARAPIAASRYAEPKSEPDVGIRVVGVVVGSDGAPVPMADVELMERTELSWKRTYSTFHAGPDGRFEVLGLVASKVQGLIARSDGWICVDPVLVVAGAHDVRIVMTRAGGIFGSLKGISDLWSGPPEVEVKGASIAPTARDIGWNGRLPLRVSHDGVFETSRLLPGSYSVRINAPGLKEPLLVVDDVVVRAGELTRDPRLQNIDVTKLGKSRVVTVVDERQRPLRSARVCATLVTAGLRSFTSSVTDSSGRATVLSLTPSVEIIVTMKGYRSAVRANVTDDVTVTLAKTDPHTVTVLLSDGIRLPEPPLFLSASLNWMCGLNEPRPEETDMADPRGSALGSKNFGDDRSIQMEVDDPGVYEVVVWLVRKSANGEGATSIEDRGGKRATVVVLEDSPASVTVTVDPGDLKQAIERAKK